MDGNEKWNKSFGGVKDDVFISVQQTLDGGYISAGYTYSYVTVSNYRGAWLIKTDINGNEQWNKTFGDSGEIAYSVQQTSDGGYIFVGYTSSPGADMEAWLVKIDVNGNEQWNKTFGGIYGDAAQSIQKTSDGGYILAGYTYSYGAGRNDAWLIKTDVNGNEQWNKTFGGIDLDSTESIQQTSDSGYIIAGYTYSYGAVSDVWLIKTDVNGNEQWNKTFKGGTSEDRANSVQQTSDGGYIIAGFTTLYSIDGNPWLIKISNGTQDFRFAQITDVHLGYYINPFDMEESVTNITDILQDTKNKNVDFIVVTGDLVEHREPEFFMAFKNIVRGFNVKTTPGNHDRRWMFWFNDLTNYKNIVNSLNPVLPGEVDWSFSHNGYNFIGLDSGADYSVRALPECTVTAPRQCYEETMELATQSTPESDGLTEALMNKLSAGDFSPENQRQVIFLHSPVMAANNDNYYGDQVDPVPPDGGPGGNDETIANHRADLIEYAINNRVDLVLTGHTHEDRIFDASGNPVASTSNNRPLFIQTTNNAYRIIDVNGGRANPAESTTPQEFTSRDSRSASFSHGYTSGLSAQYGLHAYDSQNRHTGMISCSDDFELGIPDSYYTGNYLGVSSKPEVLVGYSLDTDITTKITEFRIFSIICIPNGLSGTTAIKSAQSLENLTFNQTVMDRTNTSTTEIRFYNVTLEENSSATVNVTNVTSYKMEVDATSDGIVDSVVIPDLISISPEQPQSNISILAYDGSGVINLSTDAGNITSAGNMNVSIFPEKQFYEFPHGINAFSISDITNGSIVNITIILPQNLPEKARYWEYGKTPENSTSRWYRIPLRGNDGDNAITVQLQDGGIGDDDGAKNGMIITTGGPGITSAPEISGAVIDDISKTGIVGARVSANANISTLSDVFGFYSLNVPEGEYNLISRFEPTYYENITITVSTVGRPVVEQDIELVKKPTGNISGSVSVK